MVHERRGRAKRSAGRTRTRGGDKRRGGREGEEKEKESGKGKGKTSAKTEARRRGGETRRDPSRGIPYLSLCFPSVFFSRLALPSFLPFCGAPYRLSSQPLSLLRPYNYSPSRSGQKNFMIKKV